MHFPVSNPFSIHLKNQMVWAQILSTLGPRKRGEKGQESVTGGLPTSKSTRHWIEEVILCKPTLRISYIELPSCSTTEPKEEGGLASSPYFRVLLSFCSLSFILLDLLIAQLLPCISSGNHTVWLILSDCDASQLTSPISPEQKEQTFVAVLESGWVASAYKEIRWDPRDCVN